MVERLKNMNDNIATLCIFWALPKYQNCACTRGSLQHSIAPPIARFGEKERGKERNVGKGGERALILLKTWRYISRLLTYLLMYIIFQIKSNNSATNSKLQWTGRLRVAWWIGLAIYRSRVRVLPRQSIAQWPWESPVCLCHEAV